MAITVKHTKVSTVPDGDDTSVVRPSDWNADHQLVGTVPVENGGTGAATLTGYVKGTGTAALTASATIPNTDITGLGTASTKDAGAALGVATLDATGKVPVSELPAAVLGALSYQGTWNASTNTPTLTSSVGTKGYYYVVNVAGNTDLNGITDWQIGDWAVFNGSVWQKIDNTDVVTSVNGQVGAVVLDAADVGAVSSVSGTSPVSVATGTTTPVVSLDTGYGDTQNPYASKTANYVLAAPNGSAGTPSFRALVSADIPSLSGTYIPYTGASSAINLNTQTVVNIDHLGIGTTSVPTILMRAVGDNNSTSRIAVRGYSSNANSSAMRVTKFRGTVAAPQAPQSGDSLGKFELAGYGTTSSEGYPQASFEGLATENWGATARGAKTVIKVTPNTTTTQAVAVTINQDKSAVFESTVTATSFSGSGASLTNVVNSLAASTGISVSGSTGAVTVTNTAPDQTVALTAGTGISTSGTYPNFTITNTAPSSGGTVTSVAALTLGTTGTDLSSTVATGTTTPVITLQVPTASAANRGALSAADWTTFNGKAPATTYTTNYIPYGQGTTTPNQSAGLQFDGTNFTTTGYATATSFRPSSATVPTNGMYLPAANSVGIATASTNALYINATQQVAIGTATPFSAGAKLTVTGGGIFGDYITPTASAVPANGFYTPSANVLAISTNSANTITFNASQQVGVGVTPAYKFQVQAAGTGAVVSLARFGVTGNGGAGRGTGILIGASGSSSSVDVAQIVGYQNAASATANSAALAFQVANASGTLTEVARMFNSGGVSIGNTTDAGAGNLSVTGTIRTQGYTVATLPAAGTVGRRAYVTDALAPTFLTAIVGGGAVRCPVFDNGTVWVAG
jgi:hypothetical protein